MDSIPKIPRTRHSSTKRRPLSTDILHSVSRPTLNSKSISTLLNLNSNHSKSKSSIPFDFSFKNAYKQSNSDLLQTDRKQISSHSNTKNQLNELPRVRSTNFISDSLRNKWDVLSMCISYRNGKDLDPTLIMISSIMKGLEILSQEPGKYKEEMELIVNQLKGCVYSTRDKIPTYLQEEIFELYTDTVISMDNSVPYFYLYEALLSIYERYRVKVNIQQDLIKELESSNN